MSAPLTFLYEHKGWERLVGLEERCNAATAYALAELEGPRAGTAIVLLSDDASLAELNERFRGRSGPTNVLSFPAPEGEAYPGDIAVSFERLEFEALRDKKTLEDHAVHLVLHGILHLNGLDHVEEDEAEAMEALERQALASVGIADPYLVGTEP